MSEPRALPQQAGTAQHGTMLPLSEVAARLGVSVVTVRRRVKAGLLDGAEVKPGKYGPEWSIPLASVESALAVMRAAAPVTRTSPLQGTIDELAGLRAEVERLRILEAVSSTEARLLAGQLAELHATMRTLMLTAGPSSGGRKWWAKK